MGEGHVKTETEIGKMKPQESWQPPKAEEARKCSPPGSLEGVCPCQHTDFGILVSRTLRKYIVF